MWSTDTAADSRSTPTPVEVGRAARIRAPRSSHTEWEAAHPDRDALGILVAQGRQRVHFLLPVRYARMAESPFAYFRGAAAVMAADLAATPTSGITTQICGDAHIANFGSFASPERRQVFDVNDFDETCPGPWEWDVKRMAASAVLASRDNGHDDRASREVSVRAVKAYRDAMQAFAVSGVMDTWYSQVTLDMLRTLLPDKQTRVRFDAARVKARARTSTQALGKLTEVVDGTLRFRSDPPLLMPLENLFAEADRDQLRADVEDALAAYRRSLQPHHRDLLDRFAPTRLALKVVGVGSVGTVCLLLLLIGRHRGEPLILQVKEATQSVLEPHLPRMRYSQHGQRVVLGQRIMQSSGDIFLGWAKARGGRHFYFRQFRDMKASANLVGMPPELLARYAELCAATLAHAHARGGHPAAIAAYLGSGRSFTEAVTTFAMSYADQTVIDHQALVTAIADGTLPSTSDPGELTLTRFG